MLQCCREVWESEVGLTTSFLFNYLNKSWQWSRLGWAGLGWSHQSSPSWANNGYIPASMGCTNQPSTAPARQSSHCPTLSLFCNGSSFIIFNLWHYHIRFGAALEPLKYFPMHNQQAVESCAWLNWNSSETLSILAGLGWSSLWGEESCWYLDICNLLPSNDGMKYKIVHYNNAWHEMLNTK